MKLGITGHQELPDPAWVEREVTRIVRLHDPPVIGVTSLARGADQLFAQVLLDNGHTIEVIVPCRQYPDVFDSGGRVKYEQLLSRAAVTKLLPAEKCDEQAYFAAG